MLDDATHHRDRGRARRGRPRPHDVSRCSPPATPAMTVEDSYAVQSVWRDRGIAAGRRLVGRKIGLTSKVDAGGDRHHRARLRRDLRRHGVRERRGHPASTASRTCASRSSWRSCSASRSRARTARSSTCCGATDYVVPALEILSSRIELEGRTIVDTISRQRGHRRHGARRQPGSAPTRSTCAGSRRCSTATRRSRSPASPPRVLDHPATGVAWLANKLAQHGARLEAGEIILAGSFTRPMWVNAATPCSPTTDRWETITCRFV